MKLTYSINVEQKAAITAAQIQSLEILACDGLRLKEMLQKEYEENPCLEMAEGWRDSSGDALSECGGACGSFTEMPDICDRSDPLLSGDFIREQLDYKRYTDNEWIVINYLIGCLDDRGYLEVKPEDAAVALHTGVTTVQCCLKDLKALEPAGIFAQSLQACLKLQLERMEITHGYVYEMLDSYLEDVAGNKTEKLSRCLCISPEEADRCIRIIKKLDPFPLGGIARGETLFWCRISCCPYRMGSGTQLLMISERAIFPSVIIM